MVIHLPLRQIYPSLAPKARAPNGKPHIAVEKGIEARDLVLWN